mmetsp:Transcript_45510/g.114628  ORF Transcript_45510/g.114628 Transcript_45510/m.114628 type:complete len:358 (-) Transcript_45510:115-1188(-)
MSGQVVATLDTGTLAFHDTQLDYYGKRAAAACGAPVQPDDSKGLPEGDYTVYIWDITDNQQKLVGQLKGHEGPVWKVSWAHPKFGSLIATCSYDMKVIVWKEVNGQWQKAYVDSSHTASVNDIQFCPWEYGLRLACASSDGTVSVLTYVAAEARWQRSVFQAHPCGAQSLTWAPAVHRDGGPAPTMRLATGGCDNSVCIWKSDGEVWAQEMPLLVPAHSDWVRTVAWRPDGSSTVASGSWDKTVVIWKQEMEGHPWRQLCKLAVNGKVEGVAWSVTGSILGVSFDDGDAILYKETDDGRFEEVGKCGESGYTEVPRAASAPVAAAPGFNAPAAAPAPVVNNELAAQQQSVLDAFGLS